MRVYKKHLVNIPSVGIKNAVHPRVKYNTRPNYYTLQFNPRESILRVQEPEKESENNGTPYSLGDFLVAMEDFVVGRQPYEQQENPNMNQNLVQNECYEYPLHSIRQNVHKKAMIAEKIPRSSSIKLHTLPVESPWDSMVVKQLDSGDTVHTLHLVPFQSLQPKCENDQPNFDQMSSAEMHDYFNKKMSESKYMQDTAPTNPYPYLERPMIGDQHVLNPDSEEYDTDSVIKDDVE